MKNIITALLCCLLAVETTLHAMLFIPEEQQKIKLKTVQDIPRISLEQIGKHLAKLPQEKSPSFTFNIVLLPDELRERVVNDMFPSNKILADAYYKVPFFYACKRYHEAKMTASKNHLSQEKTEELTMRLFGLPTYQKVIINNVFNPSFSTRLAHSGPVISENTLAMIDGKVTKKIFKNQDIITVQKLEEEFPLSIYTTQCLILTSLLTIGTVPIIYAIPFVTCGFFDYCPSLSPAISATKLSALFWLYIISTTIRKRDKDKKIVLQT